jgi:hypothetical protein
MLQFIIGGFYTLIILAIGVVLGYLFGAKKIEEKIQSITKSKSPTNSGPIKSITPQEKRLESQQGIIERINELTK